jgi:RNA polymerase sigma-70 factor (ECF subfamily)
VRAPRARDIGAGPPTEVHGLSATSDEVAATARTPRRSPSLKSLGRVPGPRLPAAFRLTRAEERRLLAAARGGDGRALGRLLELLSGPVYRFGRGFCGDPDDAEDVTQITLAALARSLRRFRGESSLTTWAYTVARNACTRHRRRPAHAPARFESIAPGTATRPGALEVADPGEDPQAALERAELRESLERAIAALPAAQREVLVLRDVEGLPAKRVGESLGLSERAVKSRLHRARVALRQMLAPPEAPLAGTPRCPDTARLVSRYLEGDLDAGACARLERHVKGCPDCGAACAALRGALLTCRSWRGERLPDRIRASVRQGIRELVVEARAEARARTTRRER